MTSHVRHIGQRRISQYVLLLFKRKNPFINIDIIYLEPYILLYIYMSNEDWREISFQMQHYVAYGLAYFLYQSVH